MRRRHVILLALGAAWAALLAVHEYRRAEALAMADLYAARAHHAGLRVMLGDWTKAEALRWLDHERERGIGGCGRVGCPFCDPDAEDELRRLGAIGGGS